jgi:hypothetical protein
MHFLRDDPDYGFIVGKGKVLVKSDGQTWGVGRCPCPPHDAMARRVLSDQNFQKDWETEVLVSVLVLCWSGTVLVELPQELECVTIGASMNRTLCCYREGNELLCRGCFSSDVPMATVDLCTSLHLIW